MEYFILDVSWFFFIFFFLTDDNEETEISEETGEYMILYAKTFNFEKDETNWKGS